MRAQAAEGLSQDLSVRAAVHPQEKVLILSFFILVHI